MHDDDEDQDGFGGLDPDPRPSDSLQRSIHRLGALPLPMGTLRPLLSPLFHAWYRACIECGTLIGSDGEPYYVERALRRGEPLFEYAMCERCVFALQNELSRESIERVSAHWLARFDVEDRWRRLGAGLDPWPLVDRCALTGSARADLEEYQVWAWVRDGRLFVDDYAPGIISGAAVEEVAALLSKSTRDRLDEFMRDRLGLPPEFHNLPLLI